MKLSPGSRVAQKNYKKARTIADAYATAVRNANRNMNASGAWGRGFGLNDGSVSGMDMVRALKFNKKVGDVRRAREQGKIMAKVSVLRQTSMIGTPYVTLKSKRSK
jgi:ribosomal protein L13E